MSLRLPFPQLRQLLVAALFASAGTHCAWGGEPADSASRAIAGVARYTMRSTMIGIGAVNRLETYLSPLEYKGTEGRFLRESMRMTRMMRGHVSTQQMMEGNFSMSHSPTRDAHYLAGDFDWRIAWHYNWRIGERLRLMAGAQTGATIGVVYNTRNGNNPAQGKLAADIAASGLAIYRFRLLRREISARLQIDAPLVGLMFSPAYGQSYYEIFELHHRDHNLCATWPGNAPTLHSLLTLDVPLGDAGTLRAGWRCDVRQSRVNHLKSHAWSNLLMIGYVKHFRLVKRRDRDAGNIIL